MTTVCLQVHLFGLQDAFGMLMKDLAVESERHVLGLALWRVSSEVLCQDAQAYSCTLMNDSQL